MSQIWNDAATQYARKRLQRLKDQPATMPATPPTTKSDNYLQIARAATDLHEFMNSEEGDRANNLLNWSGCCIIFGLDHDPGGHDTIYYLDADGLHRCSQTMGIWVASASHVARPRIKSATTNEVIEAAVQYGGKNPSEIIPWLRAELDKIAAAAPEQNPTEP